MMNMFKTAVLAATLALTGAVASAATLTGGGDLFRGDDAVLGGTIGAAGSSNFTFVARQDLRIQDFMSVSAVGNQSGTSLRMLRFGYTSPDIADNTGLELSTVTNLLGSTTAFGGATLPGFVLRNGESFTFSFQNPSGSTVNTGLSFTTGAVPLPAGGLLLLTVLAGGGALARRKKKMQKA